MHIRLPTPFYSPYLNKAEYQVKQFVLNKCKKYLRSSIAQQYDKHISLNLLAGKYLKSEGWCTAEILMKDF